MADDKDMKDLADAKKLPLEDRVAHANWKVRAAAYEDISQACREIYDDADPKLSEYGPLFAKAVAEPNAAAVDKALDALAAFLQKASEQHASRICDRTCSVMVAKCLSSRTSTLNRVLEAMMLFIELEQAGKVLEALISAFTNKNPKVVVAALDFVFNIIHAFGTKVVAPQPLIKALPTLFESKDAKARDKIKEIVLELAGWMGVATVRALLLDKMRDALRDSMNNILETIPVVTKQERLTRKQQEKQATAPPPEEAAAGGDAQGVAAMEVDEMPAEADPYDFAEPKNILKDLKSDTFWDKLEEKKWTERRDAVLLLKGLADTPRIAGGDFGDVVRELKKIISKDSNVVVVAEAINTCGMLAKGLRKEFSSAARNMAGLLLEKFKEKNSNVGNAVSGTLTYMHKYCWNLGDVVEDITEAMGHANPKVKEDTYKWLASAVSQEPKPGMKALVPPLMGAAAKGAEEALPVLREAAMTFMAAFTVRFGNTAILDKFCSGMDESRKKKVQDMVAEAMGAPAPAAAAPSRPGSALPPPRTASAAPTSAVSLKSRLGTAGTSRPTTAVRASTAAGTQSAAAAGGGGAKKAGGDGEDEATLSSGALSKDQAVQVLTDLLGEATVNELQDEQWKVRLDAMDRVASRAAEPDVMASSGSALVQALSHIPGWGEKNFQVMAKQFEVLRTVAAGLPSFSKRDAFTCINGVIDKLADLKLKNPSFETLTVVSEAVGPQFVMLQLHKKAAAHKNPKVQSEAINWIARAIAEFGLAGMDVRALLDWAKEDLGSANAGVRNAAIQMLGVMFRFLGPPLGDMIRADVKPALMTAIDGEFAKVADLPKPEPTRVSRAATAARSGAGAGGKGAAKGGAGGSSAAAAGGARGGGGGGFDADDLLPRTDISGLITSELVAQLSSANWKERKAGLDAIETILTQAGNRIQPQAGDLLPELKKRLADSNKNLTTQAVSVLGRIARAMGKAVDRQARPLLPPAIKNITDQKQTVRSAVTEMLDAWVSVASASAVVPDVMEFYTSPKITADGKEETLKWLASLVSAGRVGDCAGDALKAGALGSQDKAIEVREAATKLMAALVEHVSGPELVAAAHGLDSASRKPALDAIAKATGAPVPMVAPGPVASTSGRPSTAGVRSSTTSLRSSTTAPLGRAAVSNGSVSRPGTAKAGASLKSMSGASIAAMAAQQEGPLIVLDGKKDDRAKKGRFRPAKLQIMPDEASSLEAEFSPLLGPALRASMFHKDFKKHCEAAEMVTRALPAMYEEVLSVVDLLFRWCTLRILESNTASLVKVLELLKALLDTMIEAGYRVTEYEAKLILPALVEKSGHNQDKLKAEHRELLRRLALVHPPIKVIQFVKDGLESKNSKTRVVCLDEIAAIVDRTGPSVYRTPGAGGAGPSGRPASAAAGEPLMAAVAKLVTERDTAVRGACLGVMEVLYCIEGPGLWDFVGRLTDQQKSLIEERVKTAGNKLAKAGLQPGYKAAEYGLAAPEESAAGPTPGTPQRPASPMRRSGIGMGAAASPARGGILDAASVRASVAAPPAAAAPAPSAFAAAQAVAPAAARGGYDVHRLSSPMHMSGVGLPMAASVAASQSLWLTSLEGPDEETVMSNWVVLFEHLQGDDWEAAIQGMKLLCYSYLEIGKASRHLHALLVDPRNVDELVHVLAKRVEQSFSDAAGSTQCLPNGPAFNARACKYSVNSLMNLCNVPGLANSMKDDALLQLFGALLACLIDGRLRQVPDGDGLLMAVNMLIMKLLEQANRAGVFGALVGLLRAPNPRIYQMLPAATAAALPDGGANEMLLRWNDMVVKCLIKMTKQLGVIIPTVNVGDILVHVHHYMQDLGADEVRRRSSTEDKPLRMVKTMLHELCKHRGYDIYKDAECMPGVRMTLDDMVMEPYIRLNLETLNFSAKGPGPSAASAGSPGPMPAAPAAMPRPAGTTYNPPASTSAPAPAAPAAAMPRSRGIPGAGAAAAAPPAAPPQPLAPLSTNAMAPAAAAPSAAVPPKPLVVPNAASAPPVAAAPAPAAAAAVPAPVINLEPSGEEFTRQAADDQEARNILAAIFKRIGDKAQSNQALVDLHHFTEANPGFDVLAQMLNTVSPHFRTYLTRGLSKVRIQIQHAAATAAAAAGQDPRVASPAPGKKASGGGSSWGSPDGEATVAAGSGPVTLADKLAAAAAQPHSPSSPGRLRGLGNLDELRSRMHSLSTNLNDLPVRASTANSVTASSAMSSEFMVLQERMKKIQNIAASAGNGSGAN